MKHNTILSLTRVSTTAQANMNDARQVLSASLDGRLGNQTAASANGQTVLRTSCGMNGFKKAQRGSVEAATVTANKMFTLIETFS